MFASFPGAPVKNMLVSPQQESEKGKLQLDILTPGTFYIQRKLIYSKVERRDAN